MNKAEVEHQIHTVCRMRRLSLHTERTYAAWIKRSGRRDYTRRKSNLQSMRVFHYKRRKTCVVHTDKPVDSNSRVFCSQCAAQFPAARAKQLLFRELNFDPATTEWVSKSNEEISKETGHHRDYVSKLRRKHAPKTVDSRFTPRRQKLLLSHRRTRKNTTPMTDATSKSPDRRQQ